MREVQAGDILVLATDGLQTSWTTRHRTTRAGYRPEVAAQGLVEAALARGTTDNVTVVVVHA
jgi:serine/threonine protein phosphatase PrpC